MATLLPHQRPVAEVLEGALRKYGAAFDASHCGCGKTYSACSIVAKLGLPTLVVCPKIIVPTWEEVAQLFNTEVSAINYEKLRTGNTPFGSWRVPPGKVKKRFFFHEGVKLLIFDEAHRIAGLKSQNSELGMAARRQRIPTLLLTATPAESPMQMKALGYILGLHDGDETGAEGHNLNRNPVPFVRWARRMGCGRTQFSQLDFNGSAEDKKKVMHKVHETIFNASPPRGVRVRTDEIPGFPETQIIAELVSLGDAKKIGALYEQMADSIALLKARDAELREELRKRLEKCGLPTNPEDLDHPITLVLRARQEIELLKVPSAIERVADLRADGHSVAIFCCFTQTVNEFCRRLDTQCKVVGISGAAEAEQRKTNVADFQANRERVIICSSAGDMGMGLHDLHGGHPRASIIFPDFSARNFIQRKGRVHRAGAKSKSVQYVPFAKGTVEEKPYKALKLKLSCMGALLDGLSDSDFNPFGPTVDIPDAARQTDFDEDN